MGHIEKMLTENPCYQAAVKQEVKTIAIQLVNGPQPSAKVFMHNWNRPTAMVAPHAVIDCFSGDLYQMLPWDVKACYYKERVPDDTIMLMLCEPFNAQHSKGEITLFGDQAIAKEQIHRVYGAAVMACAEICDEYGLNPMEAIRVIPKRNPEKLWSYLGNPKTVEQFKSDVAIAIDADKDNVEAPPSEPVKQYVRIAVDNLRIRTGPGREFETTGKFTGIGTFEILECQNGSGSTKGWAKLASGDGWVSLDYAEIV